MKDMHIKIVFLEEILGTSPSDPEIYRNYIATKAPTPDTEGAEVEAIEADELKGTTTVFPRMEDGTPFLYDYQIKGFFKDTCGGLRKIAKNKSSTIKAYKKEIDKLVFPYPRRIPLLFEGDVSRCQRPLRASTPQGERISLVSSETVPAGASCEFYISLLLDDDEEVVREWLDYGKWSGIGQWRNSGKGRFLWVELDKGGEVIGGNMDLLPVMMGR